jgi:tripartite-type tricarboxylate transporter receptor subunit TctC
LERRSLLALAATIASLPSAWAQSWPQRPIRIVLPFPPGGAPDTNARQLARQLEVQLGQAVIVDNKAGANGIIGMDAVAKAPPDGYTYLYTTPAFAINPSVHKAMPFDARRDFVPVTNVAVTDGYLVLINSDVAARSLRELIALAKRPGSQIGYASAGTGNSTHLAAETLNQRAGTRMLHVPYKGEQPALNGLLAGEVQVILLTPIRALPLLRSGRLRALAYTGTSRWPGDKDLPMVAEIVPGYKFPGSWHGLLAPGGTPADIVDRMQKEVARAVQQPAMRSHLVEGGYEPVASSPSLFKEHIDTEIRMYEELVKAVGITAQ